MNLGRGKEGCGPVDTLEWALFLGRAPGMINFVISSMGHGVPPGLNAILGFISEGVSR